MLACRRKYARPPVVSAVHQAVRYFRLTAAGLKTARTLTAGSITGPARLARKNRDTHLLSTPVSTVSFTRAVAAPLSAGSVLASGRADCAGSIAPCARWLDLLGFDSLARRASEGRACTNSDRCGPCLRCGRRKRGQAPTWKIAGTSPASQVSEPVPVPIFSTTKSVQLQSLRCGLASCSPTREMLISANV